MEADSMAVCSSPTGSALGIIMVAPVAIHSGGGSLEMVGGGVWLTMLPLETDVANTDIR